MAPDFLYVESSVKDALLAEIKKQITKQFGLDPITGLDYGKIINEKHFKRICGLIDEKKVVCGGFGESGMGSYHGKDGFRTFSHYKSIVDKKTWLDLPMRYQPYRNINEVLIHMFLR